MPEIDPGRLLGDLRALAKFGAYKTGVHRPTFSREDVEARHWFADRIAEAGLDATIDGIGNVFGFSRAPGRKMLTGSHLESQNHAGWLDGPLGVVYALETARALCRGPATADLGVDVAAWCDEEGHFGSFLGCRSFVGLLTEDEIDNARNRNDGTPHARGARKAGFPAGRACSSSRAPHRLCRGAYRAGRHAGERRPQDRRRHGDRRHLAVPPHGDGRAEPRRHDLAWRAAATPASRSCGSWARSTALSRDCGPRTVWTTGRIALDPGARASSRAGPRRCSRSATRTRPCSSGSSEITPGRGGEPHGRCSSRSRSSARHAGPDGRGPPGGARGAAEAAARASAAHAERRRPRRAKLAAQACRPR